MEHPTVEDVIGTLELINNRLLQPGANWDMIVGILHELAPHVNAAGKDAQAAYIAIKQRMLSGSQFLIDPRTGEQLEG